MPGFALFTNRVFRLFLIFAMNCCIVRNRNRHFPTNLKMKQHTVLIFIVLLISRPASAQDASDVVTGITEAFKEGDSRKLSAYFGTTLVMELPGKSGSYSKSQAQMIMRDFFAGNTPEKFAVDHQGNNRDGSQFLIGRFDTRKMRFRIYLIMKHQKNDLLIHHLNITEHEQ